MDKELLKIENLTIGFPTKSGIHTVVDHVNLEVGKGEIVGIVGESGSGKSMTSLAVMGLLSEEAQVSEGSIQLNGQELLGMSREERRKIQGKNMSMIFQEPMTSLNPVMKIGSCGRRRCSRPRTRRRSGSPWGRTGYRTRKSADSGYGRSYTCAVPG